MPQVKLLTLVKRRASLNQSDFLAYYLGDYTAMSKRLPGLRRYCNNVPTAIAGREPRFDLVAEAWFDELEHLEAAYASASADALRESLARISDPHQTQSLMVEERVVITPLLEGTCVKSFTTLYRRPDLSDADFDRHWRVQHPRLVSQLPGVRGYVQCPAVRAPGYLPPMDGCAIVWFDDAEAVQLSNQSALMPAVLADARLFVVPERMINVIAIPQP